MVTFTDVKLAVNEFCVGRFIGVITILVFVNTSCNVHPDEKKTEEAPFSLIDPAYSGVQFINDVKDAADFNIFTYRNFYNGGGVAIGDINNDGLADIFLTGNLVPNRLYLNRGDFRFEDITASAGVTGSKAWSTGVTMADVNSDGLLDIYVCNSGDLKGDSRENELFLNNGDLTFTEKAAEFGLADKGFSTHASFFDYDMDGDLDCYLLNNSFKSIERVDQFVRTRDDRDIEGGDKLLRNDGAKFTDVSAEAGIYGGWIGFGLGVSVSDFNDDMYPDIYISNDFWERDYLYINNGNGTFSEDIISRTSLISASSMGSDAADLDNDGYTDIFTTEMLPADNFRLKTMAKFEETNIKELKVRSSYHFQTMQNCLQFNTGDARFIETASMSNVGATDWSWGSLIFDMDNDGMKDIFVSNGIYRDITSMDFSDFVADRENIKQIVLKTGKFDLEDLLELVPSTKLSNFAFLNRGNRVFSNAADSMGLAEPSFSNGASYADLDNDGDFDLVVNNINSTAFIYRNNATHGNKFKKVKFHGTPQNRFGIGAKVYLYSGEGHQVLQNFTSRGFQSSVEPTLIFGIGQETTIDSMVVIWPDKQKQVLKYPSINETIVVKHESATEVFENSNARQVTLLSDITDQHLIDPIAHKENSFNDFDQERLMPRVVSTEGPRVLKGDLNADSFDDFILLGGAGQPDRFFYQNSKGNFRDVTPLDVARDSGYESTCGLIIDLDRDGDLDVIIGSGGNEVSSPVAGLRYYENKGDDTFVSSGLFSHVKGHFSCILPNVNDNSLDLFIGGRITPGNYGVAPRSYLLRFESGEVKDITPEELKHPGMVTSATWTDADQDGRKDLLVAGEWMPLLLFSNSDNGLRLKKAIPHSEGWWTALLAVDLNNDGREEIVAGNWGWNSKFKASPEKPIRMYVNDFDGNGKAEAILTWYPPAEDVDFPFATKSDITAQLPFLKKQNLKYGEYAKRRYDDLFTNQQRSKASEYKINQLGSAVFWNEGDHNYAMKELPSEAQVSPVFAIAAHDFDGDSLPDLLLMGNLYGLKPEVGRQDSNHGVLLRNNGTRTFESVPYQRTGIYLKGEVRDVTLIEIGQNSCFLVALNNESIRIIKKKTVE